MRMINGLLGFAMAFVLAFLVGTGPVLAELRARGAWQSSATYATDDLVFARGSTWRALGPSRGKSPTPGTTWELFAQGSRYLGRWQANVRYDIGDVVAIGGSTYLALRKSLAKKPDLGTSAKDWIVQAEGMTFRGVWYAPQPYDKGDVVTYDGSLFIALRGDGGQNRAPAGANLGTYWELLVQKGEAGPVAPLALECRVTDWSYAAIGAKTTVEVSSPNCDTGYTLIGGDCANPRGKPAVLSESFWNGAGLWVCSYHNPSDAIGTFIEGASRARCCRVPASP